MLQAAPLIRPCLLSPPTRPLTHSHPPHSQATNTNTNTNTSASAIEEIQSRPKTQPFYSIIQRQTQLQYFWLIHTLWAYFFFKIPCLVQPQNLRQKDPNRRLIVSRFDQILSSVNCLRTLRRDKRDWWGQPQLHNESIPHHWNFDKRGRISGQILTSFGLKFFPAHSYARAKSRALVGVQLVLMVARRTHNTDLRQNTENWKILSLPKRCEMLKSFLTQRWMFYKHQIQKQKENVKSHSLHLTDSFSRRGGCSSFFGKASNCTGKLKNTIAKKRKIGQKHKSTRWKLHC